MNNRKLQLFVVIVGIALIGIVYAFTIRPANAPTTLQNVNQNDQSQQLVPPSTIRYQGVEGKNALELLKSNYTVQTKEFSGLGEFVVSINGIEPDSQHFWSFYVNGQQSQVGADQYMTKNGDKIEWKLEEIKN